MFFKIGTLGQVKKSVEQQLSLETVDIVPFFEGKTNIFNEKIEISFALDYTVKISRNWIFSIMIAWGFIIWFSFNCVMALLWHFKLGRDSILAMALFDIFMGKYPILMILLMVCRKE